MDYKETDGTQELFYENITLPAVPFHPVTSFIEQFIIPVISLFGLISNTVSSIVFLQKPLRNSSCSILLAVRGIADNGFLSTLLIIWISQTFDLQLGSLSASCNIIIFLSYVCGYISVWLVVFITLENYIRICKPFVVKRFCTTNMVALCITLMCLISACFYSFTFWAMSDDNCVPFSQHHNTVKAFIYADTVITLILPLCCIIYFMTAIVCSLIKSCGIRNKLRTASKKDITNPLAKMTKMLFAVTVTYFCLNLPSHVNRLVIMISSFVGDSKEEKYYSIQEEAVQQVTLLLSYLSLSTNIIVYFIFGSKFRKVLSGICQFGTTKASGKQGGPAINVDFASANYMSVNSCNTINRSLTVLLTDKEWSCELVPLRRTYTN